MRLSYCDQLNRDIRLLSSVRCYHEIDVLRHRARRIHKGLVITNGRDKWVIWSVFKLFGLHYYWLVNIANSKFSSFTVDMDNKRLDKFSVELIDIPNNWNDVLASPETIVPCVRKAKYLHFTTATNHDGWERTNGKWLTITRHRHAELQKSLPLGKLYRAIDIGSFVPVFRSESLLVGLGVRYR